MERWTDSHMWVEINLFFPGLVLHLYSGWAFFSGTHRKTGTGRQGKREKERALSVHPWALWSPQTVGKECRHAHLHTSGNLGLLSLPRGHIVLKTWESVKNPSWVCLERSLYKKPLVHKSSNEFSCPSSLPDKLRIPCPHQALSVTTLYKKLMGKSAYTAWFPDWELSALCLLVYLVVNVAIRTATTLCSLAEKTLMLIEETGFSNSIPPDSCSRSYSFNRSRPCNHWKLKRIKQIELGTLHSCERSTTLSYPMDLKQDCLKPQL